MKKFLFALLVFVSAAGAVPGNGLETVYAYSFGDIEALLKNDDELFGRVFMDGEFLDGDLLKIFVIAEDMKTPVLGIAFHLQYEPEKLAFLRYEPGVFLENGGDPFYLVHVENGKIVFGETLRRDDAFPVGGAEIAYFYFQILDGEEFTFKFNNGVISTLDTIRQDIDKIQWDDLLLSKNGERLVGNPGSQNYDLDFDKLNVSKFAVSKILIWLALAASVSLIVFAKIQGKKRHLKSVNYK